MQVIHGLPENSASFSFSAVAIGNFDGIHKGHQALLRKAVEGSKAQGLTPVVLTFYPHPVEVLNPQKKLEQLTTTSERLVLMESLGIQFVCVAQFDQKLKELLEAVSDGSKVSSSLIREKISQGEIEKATQLLGRPYSISGMVKPGDGRGQQLGFPTANLYCAAEKILPKNGVYVSRVKWQRQFFRAITNVGVRPTFHSENSPKLVEVHVLDLNAKLYDETLELEFLSFVREEMKFDSIEKLKAQIAKDILASKNSPLFDTL
ncbi:MAG: bifunctional riboflavin kinase/FMN adenylyltransferase [Proteobacteria bacterium]|nr:bifunctional riboflavin kinase/FMN adenylyltransferase [Pseudomonadota bacterium]